MSSAARAMSGRANDAEMDVSVAIPSTPSASRVTG